MNKLGAVILAAGISSRMKEFKPMLKVDGETMISRVVSMMKRAGASPVVVVTGYRHAVLEEHLKDSGVIFARNERFWETQMLDSLLLGIAAIGEECEKILISPADIPLVRPETVQALMQTNAEFARPSYQGKPGHPALLKSGIVPILKAYKGAGGLRGAVEACGIELIEVAVDDRGIILDGDTEEEYSNLLRYRREQTGQPQPLQLAMKLCLRSETIFFDAAAAQLLELIEVTGSLRKACGCVHIDEQAGQKTVEEIERQLGYQILIPDGMENQLTKNGKRFLDAYLAMQNEILSQAQDSFERHFIKGEMDIRGC